MLMLSRMTFKAVKKLQLGEYLLAAAKASSEKQIAVYDWLRGSEKCRHLREWKSG